MPWSNQGGGPWGSGGGGKGPWGSGQQPSGPTPPDLEEFLRRSQDKLRTVLPGGSLGGKGLALIVLAAIAIWLFSGFFRVEPDELGVVLRFGAAVREARFVGAVDFAFGLRLERNHDAVAGLRRLTGPRPTISYQRG